MKKVLVGGILFAAGSLCQLITSIVFLYSDFTAQVEMYIQIGLLLLTGVFVAVLDVFLRIAAKSEEMTDRMKVLMLYGNRLSTLLLTVETLNVIALTLAYLFSIHFWAHAALVIAFAASILICILVVTLAVRGEKKAAKSKSDDTVRQKT